MKILCFGALNVDYFYHVDHLVQPGETLSSRIMKKKPGGKALNQAIAIAKAGSEVYLSGAVAKEERYLIDYCKMNKVNTEYIRESNVCTGQAIIQVDKEGRNNILLYGGANQALTNEDVDDTLKHFNEGDFLVLQNEINQLGYLIERAYEKKMKIFFNPSPFEDSIKNSYFEKSHAVFLNQIEGEQLTGKRAPTDMLDELALRYPSTMHILTLGEEGVYLQVENQRQFCPAKSVNVVDSTGAGDTFMGYFISLYSKREPYKLILETATKAASIAITRLGASESIPKIEELN